MSVAGLESLEIREACWPKDEPLLRRIRTEVFVREQEVPEDLEWDGLDASSRHLLALVDREPVGTGRLAQSGKIGRMAVLSTHRGRGIGDRLLAELVQLAVASGHQRTYLHAQVHATGFYARQGFRAEGDEFMEAGIAHRQMYLDLAPKVER